MQENLRVLDIPQQQIIDLSVFLSGKFKVYTASKGSILICVPWLCCYAMKLWKKENDTE